MKTLILLISFCVSCILCAQDQPKPEETIIAFFNAFHQQDTVALRNLVHPRVRMQSIAKSKTGVPTLTTSNFNDFLKSIASIPETTVFQERILDYKVTSDGVMANVWTPYEFYVDYKRSHCGVNNFQLLFIEKQWKIFYIVDTRKTEDCN
ncbi:3-methyl-2-oxobutanoate hydroxymethyltransferase [Leeuwenhoekiella sp. MAR_2009_132]|uniref:3-methyl-2-oxobutanoate hydroxymethyltransferase n=1 Tax=Leeuwenhoekiella sp. MAR_2009_132 TaxID=1392489 RepID=UPI00048BCDA8|nr:3-methyl-2-oxobutanoate hydroxymethyltransferase [Leeuwenhoekiella sp. MAR_2009_132]